MRKLELVLPADWACYLFYGDSSGLLDGEADKIDQFLERHRVGCVLTTKEQTPFATSRNDYDSLYTDCHTYIFPRR
jgi:hypothetical protein